ncbi:MAG: hypothetical protein AAGD25_06695 [Cyanobacteria bacterium P01_F01_bin.150]
MPTKVTKISAQSLVGWAPIGSDRPRHTGNIKTIVTPPKEAAQWFVGRRSNRGTSADACNWFRITSTAQVSPNGVVHGAVSELEQVHADICDFLWDFDLAITYQYEVGRNGGRKPSSEKSRYELTLSKKAIAAIKKAGGASAVEEWAKTLN